MGENKWGKKPHGRHISKYIDNNKCELRDAIEMQRWI